MLYSLGFILLFTLGGLLHLLAPPQSLGKIIQLFYFRAPALASLACETGQRVSSFFSFWQTRPGVFNYIKKYSFLKLKSLKITICWKILTIILLLWFYLPYVIFNFEQSFAGNLQIISSLAFAPFVFAIDLVYAEPPKVKMHNRAQFVKVATLEQKYPLLKKWVFFEFLAGTSETTRNPHLLLAFGLE
jgi:hypothetical protein